MFVPYVQVRHRSRHRRADATYPSLHRQLERSLHDHDLGEVPSLPSDGGFCDELVSIHHEHQVRRVNR